jgi:hypothetical protein
MNCYVCQTEGRTTSSVALCQHCQAALCMSHVRDAVAERSHQPGPLTCAHSTWSAPVAAA